jgi:hypothetical protein
MQKKNIEEKEARVLVDSLVVLPKIMVDKVNTIFISAKTKNHVFSFISQLATSSHEKYKITTGSVPFPASRFRIHFGSSYHNWLNPLLNSQIVMKNDYYSKDKQKCLDYWINPIYDILENTKSCNFPNVAVAVKLSVKKMSTEELRFQTQVTNDFKNLHYDELKLNSIVKKHIDNFSLDDYVIDLDILEKKFDVIYTDRNGLVQKRHMTREVALINSKENKQNLIFDKKKNKYYSYDFQDFIVSKKSAVERYYLETILKLVNKKVYATRNKTNFRVDTNMTNCPSLLLEQIMSDNNLCQIDMSNAQFAILANNIATKNLMIPHFDDVPKNKKATVRKRENELIDELELLLKSSDFIKFIDLASNGNLYTEIQKELGFDSRGEAKKIMFQILFSSEKVKNDLKVKLVKMFPNVIAYIDNYKKCYGYKNFSIGLQKRESEIFIDEIYMKLKKANIKTITRHDSFIVNFEDEIRALEIINKSLKNINFNCILKREGRVSNRFYELSKVKQVELDLGINRIIQVIRPITTDLDTDEKILPDDDFKDSKKTRLPKKSSLNFDK